MRAEVQRHYPHIWQELEGLAQGLEATVDQVFAWNCRGDLVRSTSDGCTTVAGVNAAGERIIAHAKSIKKHTAFQSFRTGVFSREPLASLL